MSNCVQCDAVFTLFFSKKCIRNKNIRCTFLSACEQVLGAFWWRSGKRKDSLQLRITLWNLNIGIEKVDAKCWLAEMTLVMTSLPLARVAYIRVRFRFTLIGRNLTAQSTGAIGNWRWNSKFRGVVEGSPTFSLPAARAPRELALRLLFRYTQKNWLHSHLL